ncbi:MAG TPA: magnesium-translocating P-type ATPase [Candidatus Baltobacteraceae bacterium]|jgi:Mg2+-importing ATPase|nr:magnesium-translocating P-type ATPase [Candidatus Baltobacteraceae bacterium]
MKSSASSVAPQLNLVDAARLPADAVLGYLGSRQSGLSTDEAAQHRERLGDNAVATHSAGATGVFLRQLRNPLLLLLAATAIISIVLGEHTDAFIILGIVVLSVGLGFLNEYRSERAIADLHTRIRHTASVLRDGAFGNLDVSALVPGDIVLIDVGDIVPADLRLLEAHGLECDEAILTGESLPAAKTCEPAAEASAMDLPSCALMGTIVHAGSGTGVVVRTGASTAFGQIAAQLVEHAPQTAFQHGLQRFSGLLVWITMIVTGSVFLILTFTHHSIIESLLFALAIAVSLTPQLLPAIVTVSLAAGARAMAKRSVIVKRLVSIEDFGNMEVLFTDKTGTLTEGRITFASAIGIDGRPSDEVLRLGRLCTPNTSAGTRVLTALDAALCEATDARKITADGVPYLAEIPFDYERRMLSVLVDDGKRRRIITKGAPESVFARCSAVPPALIRLLNENFSAGSRIVAVAARNAADMTTIGPKDECDLIPLGLLLFTDPPKTDAAESIARLERLGIAVKIITGDNDLVARKVCSDIGITVAGTLTGAKLATMNDSQITEALETTTIFSRVSPEQKAHLIRLQRAAGVDVGFLGDGVNDAIALHEADVGISVDSACDVAKDAADVVMLTKDLGILADGVVAGRRIFTNTIKYILMGTSSNFGNMISTSVGSLFLPFLPMLPSQILLNNLLYDFSEMTIPTDNVDEEQVHRPAHWDMRLIERFMIVFGPINALCDFTMFALMLLVYHASAELFRSAYFAESFITQTLIIFAIRTRRVPFLRSSPSWQLAVTTIGVTIIGAILPFSPLGLFFGFAPLPLPFIGLIAAFVIVYVVMVEIAKTFFFRSLTSGKEQPLPSPVDTKTHRTIDHLRFPKRTDS